MIVAVRSTKVASVENKTTVSIGNAVEGVCPKPTAEHMATMPDDGRRYGIINGVIRMLSPAGRRHGRIAGPLNKLLAIHVDDHGLNTTFAAETGFRISSNPDAVRASDGSCVGKEEMVALEDGAGYLPLLIPFV